jgi:DNA-binding protein HU-beta
LTHLSLASLIGDGHVTINLNNIIIYMNKAQLVAEVQKSLGADTSKAAAERSIEAVLEGIKKGVKKDKNVQLIGFGTFSVTKRAARDGINPQTREKIRIKASKAVKFKAGAGLKAVL